MPRQTKTAPAKNGKSTKKKTKQDSGIHSQVICPACHGKNICPECGGAKKVQCNDCGGSGNVDCPVCHEGHITKSRHRRCERCEGDGYVYLSDGVTTRTCTDCDGEGEIEIDYEELCPNCHGDYKNHKKCPTCRGKGKIACNLCDGTGKTVCPVCKDEGFSSIESACIAIAILIEDSYTNLETEVLLGRAWVGEFLPALTDAAKQDNGMAMYVLGLLYSGTDGGGSFCEAIPADDEKAEFWIHKAAEYGIAEAQSLYGKMLEQGNCGVEKDLNGALEWYDKASNNGDAYASKRIAELQKIKKTVTNNDSILQPSPKGVPQMRHKKHRWVFILIGIFFGLLGLQFVYARRWKFFFAHWVSFVAAIIWMPKVFSVCIALWLGSIFFMKRDGKGDRM